MTDDAPLTPDAITGSALPGILSRARVVVTPYPFGVSDADLLRVTVVNSLAGVVVNIHGRQVAPGADAKPFNLVMVPTSNRLASSQDFVIGGGFVTNLTVFASGASPRIGQTFVIVQLIRSAGATAFLMGTLLQGYVTSVQALGWPGSPIESSLDGEPPVLQLTTASPALGTDWHTEVPTGARWSIENVFTGLTTAGAATRIAILQISRGGVFTVFINPTQSQVGALAANYTWAPNLPYDQKITATIQNGPLPAPCLLSAGDQIGSFTVGMTAFDQWNPAQISYREWLEAQA